MVLRPEGTGDLVEAQGFNSKRIMPPETAETKDGDEEDWGSGYSAWRLSCVACIS